MTLWSIIIAGLSEGDVTPELAEKADTWGEGLEVELPPALRDDNGVPKDTVLQWLSIQFSWALSKEDTEKARALHSLFHTRKNELLHGNDPFLYPSETVP